jgi:hypothetical protein
VKQHLKFCLQYLYEKNGVELSLKYCGIFVDHFLFLLAIVVSVLQFMASDYPIGVFGNKHFWIECVFDEEL